MSTHARAKGAAAPASVKKPLQLKRSAPTSTTTTANTTAIPPKPTSFLSAAAAVAEFSASASKKPVSRNINDDVLSTQDMTDPEVQEVLAMADAKAKRAKNGASSETMDENSRVIAETDLDAAREMDMELGSASQQSRDEEGFPATQRDGIIDHELSTQVPTSNGLHPSDADADADGGEEEGKENVPMEEEPVSQTQTQTQTQTQNEGEGNTSPIPPPPSAPPAGSSASGILTETQIEMQKHWSDPQTCIEKLFGAHGCHVLYYNCFDPQKCLSVQSYYSGDEKKSSKSGSSSSSSSASAAGAGASQPEETEATIAANLKKKGKREPRLNVYYGRKWTFWQMPKEIEEIPLAKGGVVKKTYSVFLDRHRLHTNSALFLSPFGLVKFPKLGIHGDMWVPGETRKNRQTGAIEIVQPTEFQPKTWDAANYSVCLSNRPISREKEEEDVNEEMEEFFRYVYDVLVLQNIFPQMVASADLAKPAKEATNTAIREKMLSEIMSRKLTVSEATVKSVEAFNQASGPGAGSRGAQSSKKKHTTASGESAITRQLAAQYLDRDGDLLAEFNRRSMDALQSRLNPIIRHDKEEDSTYGRRFQYISFQRPIFQKVYGEDSIAKLHEQIADSEGKYKDLPVEYIQAMGKIYVPPAKKPTDGDSKGGAGANSNDDSASEPKQYGIEFREPLPILRFKTEEESKRTFEENKDPYPFIELTPEEYKRIGYDTVASILFSIPLSDWVPTHKTFGPTAHLYPHAILIASFHRGDAVDMKKQEEIRRSAWGSRALYANMK